LNKTPKPATNAFWPRILQAVPVGALLILDLGFTNFKMYAQMTTATFITRAKSNLCFQVKKVYLRTSQVEDLLVWIGTGDDRQLVRLVKVRYQGKWYRYLTNELDPSVLPAPYVAALYRQRWRIEDAYNVVKRLLGLAYFWNGSQYGVQLQVWATWILYAILVDLTDAVAEVLGRPFVDYLDGNGLPQPILLQPSSSSRGSHCPSSLSCRQRPLAGYNQASAADAHLSGR